MMELEPCTDWVSSFSGRAAMFRAGLRGAVESGSNGRAIVLEMARLHSTASCTWETRTKNVSLSNNAGGTLLHKQQPRTSASTSAHGRLRKYYVCGMRGKVGARSSSAAPQQSTYRGGHVSGLTS
jgi:hypothetical protein